jgi:NAD(P)-dependent dehydrogenase (short-subunit alcohol dehydrogenase family)
VKSVEICYKEVERRVGARGLDYLVNNAGRSTSSAPIGKARG